jgi:transcriptional regulator with XRE-family HTH domain
VDSDEARGGTDVGRRIMEQRRRAGLSREAAAELAGLSPEYLTYLETSLTPSPSRGDLARLAAALGAPAAALTGAGQEMPPGQGTAAPRPALETMTAAECRTHLANGGIGRFLFAATRGPVAVPVNFAMLGDDVVFRTDDRTAAAGAIGQHKVSFDVDHIDEALSEGWSVLVSGTASILTNPDDLRAAAGLGIQPWAGGDRGTYIRLVATEVTGRRIRNRAVR